MSDDDNRTNARFLTDLNVVLRPTGGGPPIDDRATAHEISVKGFKVETQVELVPNTVLAFTLELPAGLRANGKGRVVWSNRETFATWAGIKVVSMSWADKRRLSQVIEPDIVDWSRLVNACVKLVAVMTIIIAAHHVLGSSNLRALFVQLLPKFAALTVMGWALVNLLKRDRR